MPYRVNALPLINDLKKLARRHHNLKSAFEEMCLVLESKPRYGEPMVYLPNPFKGKVFKCRLLGSGGFRAVYYWDGGEDVVLLTIFQRKKEYNVEKIVRRIP